MRFFIILSAVVLLATASDRNNRQKSDWTRQIIRNNQNHNNPLSSSSESHEQLSNILKTKVYNPNRCVLIPTPTSDEIELFHQWTSQHNKQYSSERERSCRMINVINTIRENHIHNQRYEEGKVSYKRGLNHLSDLTMQEVSEQILMNNPPKLQLRRSSLGDLPELPEAREFVDYREEGLVGPVAQQGGCGSCYAWASAAVLEGQLRKCDIYKNPVSVQNMVDCATDCAMCEGGLPYYVFEYQKRGGILPADKYPYLDRNGTCKFSKTDTIAYVDRNYGFDLESIRTRHEYIKKIVSTVGPVAVALLAEDSFKDYESGIYDINNCGNEINHAVTIVGYGTDSRHGDYWLIKNSWGKYWGEKGYGRLAMGKNLCQIENIVMFAQVRDTKGKVCQLFDF